MQSYRFPSSEYIKTYIINYRHLIDYSKKENPFIDQLAELSACKFANTEMNSEEIMNVLASFAKDLSELSFQVCWNTKNVLIQCTLSVDRDPKLNEQLCSISLLKMPCNPYTEEIHIAAEYGFLEAVIHLVKTKPGSIRARNKLGKTPLQIAICQGHVEVVIALLESGASIKTRDNKRNTPLDTATSKKQHRVIEKILEIKQKKEFKFGSNHRRTILKRCC